MALPNTHLTCYSWKVKQLNGIKTFLTISFSGTFIIQFLNKITQLHIISNLVHCTKRWCPASMCTVAGHTVPRVQRHSSRSCGEQWPRGPQSISASATHSWCSGVSASSLSNGGSTGYPSSQDCQEWYMRIWIGGALKNWKAFNYKAVLFSPGWRRPLWI